MLEYTAEGAALHAGAECVTQAHQTQVFHSDRDDGRCLFSPVFFASHVCTDLQISTIAYANFGVDVVRNKKGHLPGRKPEDQNDETSTYRLVCRRQSQIKQAADNGFGRMRVSCN